MLPFSVLTSTSLTSPGCFKPSVSSKNNVIGDNNSESKPPESGEKAPQTNGGLVTGAPSPPDVKDNSVKPQISTDRSGLSTRAPGITSLITLFSVEGKTYVGFPTSAPRVFLLPNCQMLT